MMPQITKKINQQRVLAIGIDYIVIRIFSRILAMFLLNNIEILAIGLESAELQFAFFVVFMCLKDTLFKNASLGKKLLGLVVVKKSGYEPHKKALILRNILLVFIFPLELYRFFVEKDERYGDVVANTKVVYKVEQLPNSNSILQTIQKD